MLGGLAAQKPGEPVAWGPCRCHSNAEEAPTEHAHIDPCFTEKHEMETISSAGMMTALSMSISV